jgi:glycosyltransferase involved in cell wall biosynthesis
MRVAVVSEYYPRRYDPVLGVWAHRQALAARDHGGADIEVFVLHRLVPPAASARGRELWARLRQPRHVAMDGLLVHYVPYVSPPRSRAYASWAAWCAPALRRALARRGPFDLVHAHNAVPAGDAALRACELPLVVSVHGGDVLWTISQVPGGSQAVRRVYGAARSVLANSVGIASLAASHGARDPRVVHLGSEIPADPAVPAERPLLCTVGHLVARKCHADVLHALARLPAEVSYLVIGDGPERPRLEALAATLGVSGRVTFCGQLEPAAALARSRAAWLFVMPSTEEAFGVAYVEAMAAGIPAVGCAGEPGPEEIGGAGMVLVPARDPQALAARLGELLAGDLGPLRRAARETVSERFSWEQCGRATAAAYGEALA